MYPDAPNPHLPHRDVATAANWRASWRRSMHEHLEQEEQPDSRNLPAGDGDPTSWQRFFMGYRERFVDDCILELQGGAAKVLLSQAPSATGPRDKGKGAKKPSAAVADPALTGTTVWDGAVMLSQALTYSSWLQQHLGDGSWPSGAAKPHCLELGAGTGAVGLSLAACHLVSSVTISDLPEMLPHIDRNVKKNAGVIQTGPDRAGQHRHKGQQGSGLMTTGAAGMGALHMEAAAVATAATRKPPTVLVRPLRWGPMWDDVQALALEQQQQQQQRQQQRAPCHVQSSNGPPYDLVVGSDLIYYSYTEATPHTKLLLWTLERVSCTGSLIYLALSLQHNPEEVAHFLKLAEERFQVTQLQQEVPQPWRVLDHLVVLLRPKDAASRADQAVLHSTTVPCS